MYVQAYVEKLRLCLLWICFYFLTSPTPFCPQHSTQKPSQVLGSYHVYLCWLVNRFVFSCLPSCRLPPRRSVHFSSTAVLFCLMRKDNQPNKLGVLWLTLIFVTQGNPNEGTNKILPRKTFLTISITVLIGWVWLPDYPLISTRMLFGKQLKYALHGSSLHPFSTF